MACPSIFVLAVIAIPLIYAKHLPSYITPCRKDDKNLNLCGVESANKALPYILKGDPDFKIPTFDPFFIPLVETRPSANFLFRLRNTTLKGLDTLHVVDMNIDLPKRHISLKATVKQIETNSVYETDGKLFSIAVKGQGPARIITDDITIEYSMNYNITSKNGKDYIDIKSIESDLVYTPGKVTYNFQNLFGSNKLLGDNFNQLLNDNPEEVESISGSTNQQIVSQIVFEVFKVLFRVVPYDEIFL